MLNYLKGCTQGQVKLRLTIPIFHKVVLDPLDSTAKSVYEPKNTQSLGYDCIAVVIHIREVIHVCLAIKPSMILDFYTVIVLIELYRAIRVVCSVTYSVHKQLSCSPMRIVNNSLLTEYRHRNGTSICDSSINKSVELIKHFHQIT